MAAGFNALTTGTCPATNNFGSYIARGSKQSGRLILMASDSLLHIEWTALFRPPIENWPLWAREAKNSFTTHNSFKIEFLTATLDIEEQTNGKGAGTACIISPSSDVANEVVAFDGQADIEESTLDNEEKGTTPITDTVAQSRLLVLRPAWAVGAPSEQGQKPLPWTGTVRKVTILSWFFAK